MGFLFAALLLGQTLFFMALLLSLGRPWGGIFPKKTAGTHPRRLAAGCVPVSMIPFILFGSLPEAPLFLARRADKTRATAGFFLLVCLVYHMRAGLSRGGGKNGENRIEKGTRVFRTFDASA